jgi:hypothetical protein
MRNYAVTIVILQACQREVDILALASLPEGAARSLCVPLPWIACCARTKK